jgi:hypothetical protein
MSKLECSYSTDCRRYGCILLSSLRQESQESGAKTPVQALSTTSAQRGLIGDLTPGIILLEILLLKPQVWAVENPKRWLKKSPKLPKEKKIERS